MNNALTVADLAAKLSQYQPSEATKQLVRDTPILLLVGISGAGKDTVASELFRSGNYHPIISHTTRQPRINDGLLEQDGVEYHFINLEQSEQMLDAGQYIEANVYGGNVYGTSVAEIQAAHDTHKIAATDLEVQGVAEYKAIDPNVKAVFILPPSYDVWQERLSKRYTGSADPDELHKRQQIALQELEHAIQTDYFAFVVNDSLPETIAEVNNIANGELDQGQNDAALKIAHELRDELKRNLAA